MFERLNSDFLLHGCSQKRSHLNDPLTVMTSHVWFWSCWARLPVKINVGGIVWQLIGNCYGQLRRVVITAGEELYKYSWLRTGYCWKIQLTPKNTKSLLWFSLGPQGSHAKPHMQKWGSSIIMHNFWEVWILGPSENLRCWWSYVHQKGSLHNGLIILTLFSWWPRQWVVTEPACHKCQTLWQFLPRKLTVIMLAHPNSWHHHHPSRCQHLCRHKVGLC